MHCYDVLRELEPKLNERFQDLQNLQSEKLPTPFLSSLEIMAMGITQGPLLGKIKDELYRLQLSGQIKSKSEAEAWVNRK